MRTALDADFNTLDEHEKDFVANIREHGWFRTSVFAEGDQLGFSYTTGFWISAKAPEIITFSMKDEIAHQVFWDLFHDSKDGVVWPIAKKTSDVFASTQACLFPVSKRRYRDHLDWSRWFYNGDDFPCLQLVWPDRAGLFPWENGFDGAFRDSQPDLSEDGWAAAFDN